MKISNVNKFIQSIEDNQEEVPSQQWDDTEDLNNFLDDVVEHGKTYKFDGTVGQTLVKEKSVRPLLLVSAMCKEELSFIKSLESKIADIADESLIDVCYLIESGAKPICRLPLTFDIVMAIKSYRDMDMEIVFNGRRELTYEAIMNLP